jgi:hypothetical protein
MTENTSSGIPELRAWLKALPNNIKEIAARAVAEYLVGDESHGLKHYPNYAHVPWSQVGGFVSDKQRRYVMARIREGSIEPGVSSSNGYFRDAWQYKAQGSRYVITNDVGYAKYLVGPGSQSRRAIAQGWRTTVQNISDNMLGAMRHARAEIGRWIREHKRS